MALVPARQLYPASLFDSFQSSKVRFFRYGSSITLKKYTFYITQQQQQYSVDPRRRYKNFARNNQRNTQQHKADKDLSSGNWIEKWSETHQPNQPKQHRAVVDYETDESESESGLSYGDRDRDRSSEINGDSGGTTMEKIVEKLKRFGYMEGERESKVGKVERVIEKGSVEDIFYVEEGLLPNSRGGFSGESPLGDGNLFGGGNGEVRFPWEKPREKEDGAEGSARKRARTSLAELTLPESELRRLRNLTFQKKHKTRIGSAGVTQEVVNMIHEKWKASEIVRLKIEGAPALNMKRMHEILERKTGGLVVWRSGTSLSLYRGVSYEVPALHLNKRIFNRSDVPSTQKVSNTPIREIAEFSSVRNTDTSDTTLEKLESTSEENKDAKKPPEVHYEAEMDEILDSLGPRYEDWPGADPLPVDADRLQGIVPNYQPPFRVLPYGVRRSLGQREETSLRRLARVLPPHFAIGRSRQLQGLAVAMIKLWEKSSIAKIALKRGVQLTTSERMAEEIKILTGGVLLSRNKDFMVFYRGKNFLSAEVTEALMERERLAKSMQDKEELARLRASAIITPQIELPEQSATAGTLGETLDADAKWGMKLDDSHKEKVLRQAEIMRHAEVVRKLEKNLAIAEKKLVKAERALAKVEISLHPSNRQADPESITEEERFMFRKLGLRMKAFLLLGRRGVFDGTVENMHLHWKYRELIKVVVNARTFEQVKKVALALEAESGGVLVTVDRISKKKFAIVVFRGKDYKRPSILRPKNLLTKRKALARSIEIQRQQALLKHITAVQNKVDKLRSELEQMDTIKDRGDEALYEKLDSAYPTSDEESDDQSEEEDDEAYLETYGDEDDGEDESNDLIRNLYEETDSTYDDENFELESEPEIPDLYSKNGPLTGDEELEEEHTDFNRADPGYINQNLSSFSA